MKYDFDTIINRRRTGSLKWDVAENELPMWVADMDFQCAPEIMEAMKERIQQKVFGYNIIPDGWYEAYRNWWRMRHGIEIDRDWLVFCTGIVPAISSTVRKLVTPNENVVILTPVYNVFYNSIINNGARVLESPLIYDNGEYDIDWIDLEKKLADPQTALMIFCNPHNPVGRIWDRETLARVGSLCARYHVTVVSDEIHCDITRPGISYVPFISASEECMKNTVMCVAPTKAFNIAGMQSAAVVVPDPFLRHKIWRALNTDEVAEPNTFACAVAEAAFNRCGEWLDELREYVFENRRIAEEYIRDNIPGINAVKGDATYLMWLDARELEKALSEKGVLSCPDENDPEPESEGVAGFIRMKTGLFLTSGSFYGSSGKGFMRMNIACPRTLLADGLKRLEKSVKETDNI